MHLRHLRGARALAAFAAWFAAACGEAHGFYCGESAAALYGGSPEPGTLVLDSADRAAIVGVHSSGGTLLCTGTRIAEGWVLTAAHCALGNGLLVATAPQRFVDARRLVTHPELDAMLIELGAEMTSELDGHRSLRVSGEALGPEWLGATVTMAGRGEVDSGPAGELRFVEEPITQIDAVHVRVDGRGRTGACAGDSGGPLLSGDAAGRARVIGVLEKGASTCRGEDLYIRTDVLRGWVVEHVQANGSSVCNGQPR